MTKKKKKKRFQEEKEKKNDPEMKKNQTVKTLLDLLVKKSGKFTADQRLRLGATILVEGILIANNPSDT